MVRVSEETGEYVRAVLRDYGGLRVSVDRISDDHDLFDAGMTSNASVNVMLALEDAFEVEFPDQMLNRSVFMSVRSISTALAELKRPI